MDTRITANKEFCLQEMHTSLYTRGFYCYHDTILESVIPDTIEWVKEKEGFYVAKMSNDSSMILETIADRLKETLKNYFNLSLDTMSISQGIDVVTDTWHTDSIEMMGLQCLLYQDNLTESDGGSLGVKCFDSVERHYYPKNGDIMILNHQVGVEHKVFPILSNKKRIVIHTAFKL